PGTERTSTRIKFRIRQRSKKRTSIFQKAATRDRKSSSACVRAATFNASACCCASPPKRFQMQANLFSQRTRKVARKEKPKSDSSPAPQNLPRPAPSSAWATSATNTPRPAPNSPGNTAKRKSSNRPLPPRAPIRADNCDPRVYFSLVAGNLIADAWRVAGIPVLANIDRFEEAAALFVDFALQLHQRVQQHLRTRRAAGNVNVHGNHLVHALHNRVIIEHAAGSRAHAHRNHPLRLGHLIVELLDHRRHFLRNAPRDDHQVRLPRRAAKNFRAESRHVESRRREAHHLNRATRQPKRHRPNRTPPRPVHQLVQLREQNPFLLQEICRLFGRLQRHALRQLHRHSRLSPSINVAQRYSIIFPLCPFQCKPMSADSVPCASAWAGGRGLPRPGDPRVAPTNANGPTGGSHQLAALRSMFESHALGGILP